MTATHTQKSEITVRASLEKDDRGELQAIDLDRQIQYVIQKGDIAKSLELYLDEEVVLSGRIVESANAPLRLFAHEFRLFERPWINSESIELEDQFQEQFWSRRQARAARRGGWDEDW